MVLVKGEYIVRMPKSKRDKKISLTRTTKKGLELKQNIIQEIRKCVDAYARIFVFSVENMRNNKLKDVRQEWKHSRFFFGKNKIMALALGKTPETEHQQNLHKVSKRLEGQCGLLFTNKQLEEVARWFSEFVELDYARSGNIADEKIVIDKGPFPDLHFSLEPQLRQLGLPTSLQKGVVTFVKDHTVCEEGDVLNPEQSRILKLLGRMMAEFRISLSCMWSNDGSFEEIADGI